MELKNPYVGPRSFELNEKLYGRDRERRQLTDRLIAERIVLLHSPSGAGKTSLVRAGLIPQLQEEGFFVHPVIRVNLERSAGLAKHTAPQPGASPFNRYTFSTLLSLEEEYSDEMHLDLNQLAQMTLDEYLKLRARDGKREGPEFLIFDQFEEILTIDPTDREAKKAFLTQVGAALKNRDRWALFAMRTDFVAALEPYVRLVPTYFSNTFHLELLGLQAAIEAVEKPARDAGIEFTVATTLVKNLSRIQVQQLDGSTTEQEGLYVEPVQLQVVCYRIWERSAKADKKIDAKDLKKVGDINQSLADYYADSVARVAQETQLPERSIREWFDSKLITADGIRSQVRMGTEASDGLSNKAVSQLANTYIIRAEKRAGQTWYELAHDRLIKPVQDDNWNWFEANLTLFQRQAVLWSAQGRSEGLLLRGAELDTAEQQAQGAELTPDETAFLEACRNLRAREKRDRLQRRLILVGAIVSFVFFIAALIATWQAYQANADLVTARQAAEAASTLAIDAQYDAQAASTKAYEEATKAALAEDEAVKERDNAQKQAAIAQTQEAIAYEQANAAATAQAVAYQAATEVAVEKSKADAQALAARSNELVAKSILANNQNNLRVAVLLALEAFQLDDNPATRNQLLNFISGSLALYQTPPNAGLITHVAFGGENNLLLTGNVFCKEDTLFVCTESVLKFWNIANANGVMTRLSSGATSQLDSFDALALDPTGQTVATAFCDLAENTYRCDQEDIILWDVKTQARAGLETAIAKDALNNSISNNALTLMAYSPDGKWLAVGLSGNTIVILDAKTLAVSATLSENYESYQLGFSRDSRYLLFANNGQLVRIEVASGQKTSFAAGVGAKSVLSIAISPDGKYFATGDRRGYITLWDADFKKLEPTLSYNIAKVVSLAFSPDGTLLAAGYDDKGLVIWDLESKQRLMRPLYNHTTNTIYDLTFSRDGKTLASTASEIILWTFDPAQWIKKACQAATGNLTQAEWKLYFPADAYRQTCSQYPVGK